VPSVHGTSRWGEVRVSVHAAIRNGPDRQSARCPSTWAEDYLRRAAGRSLALPVLWAAAGWPAGRNDIRCPKPITTLCRRTCQTVMTVRSARASA